MRRPTTTETRARSPRARLARPAMACLTLTWKHFRGRRRQDSRTQSQRDPPQQSASVLRSLIGVRVSEKGQLDVEDVGWNLMPWNLLMNIRKEVAKEMQLDMSNAFGYAATQACLDKYRILVWTACEKSEEGRWWMTKWPWQVVDQPRRPAPGHPGDLNNHRVKNVMKVLG